MESKLTHKLFQQQIGKITILQTKVRDIKNNLIELKERCSRLFKAQCFNPTASTGNTLLVLHKSS